MRGRRGGARAAGYLLGCTLLLAGIPLAVPAELRAQPSAEALQAPAAAKRAEEVVALIASGNRAAIDAYVRANVDPDAARGPGPATTPAGLIAALHFSSRGAALDEIRPTSPTSVTARYRNAMTGRLAAVHVRVDPKAPHRIVELARRRVAAAGSPLPPTATDADRTARLDAMVKRMADADYFSGVVMIARAGKPIFAKAYGMADRERQIPNGLDTRFNIGSMNKLFTATAIAQLVEQGKLSYDDPLSKFMPDFPDPESAKRIRLKHLLTHTAGLGSYFNQAFFSRPPTSFRTIAAYLDVAREPGLAFEPGSNWSYSNTGYLVAGRIVEIVSDRDYYHYVREHIYKPAGMTRTDSYELDRQADRAIGYDAQPGPDGPVVRNVDAETVVRGSPAGGGLATAGDLLRFANAFRAGKLVRPETAALMMAPKPELGSPNYGYGFDLGRLAPEDRKIAGHGGDSPGTCAIFDTTLDTPEPYTIIVLSNGNAMGNCHPIAQEAYDLFAPR